MAHIFLPPFARIIIITLIGPLGLCVIQIILHKLRSKYMEKQMVDFNVRRYEHNGKIIYIYNSNMNIKQIHVNEYVNMLALFSHKCHQ